VGAGFAGRQPWPAAFLLMQSVCGFACGFAAAAAQPQSLERPHSKFSKQKKI